MKTKVTSNSIWVSTDGTKFQVENVVKHPQGRNVVYSKLENKSLQFKCLEDAFVLRFSKFINVE